MSNIMFDIMLLGWGLFFGSALIIVGALKADKHHQSDITPLITLLATGTLAVGAFIILVACLVMLLP
jgi:hypothetical protein